MGAFREAMEAEMTLRGFAASTHRAYANWMARLVADLRVPADQITEKQVRDHLVGLSSRGLSSSTVNQARCCAGSGSLTSTTSGRRSEYRCV